MRQVAELAGVSVQTVSNHVNGRFRQMAPDTRTRVDAAMRELGYHPNLTARGLRSAETRTLGFLVLDEHARFLADPLTDLIIAGVGDVAREQNYGILIQASQPHADVDRLLTPVLESRVDGAFVLLSGEKEARTAHIDRLGEVTEDYLVFDEPLDDPSILSVRAADREAGRIMGRHLIERGHRRIGCIGSQVPWAVVEQRFAGLVDALSEAAIEPEPDLFRFEVSWEPGSAVPVAEGLLRRDDPPTAIMCMTDLLALATIHTAKRLGLSVPGDVAVSGFDDFPFSEFVDPALTTIRIPAYEMGREAARILIAQLRDGDVEDGQRELPVELMVRSST